MRKLFAFPIVLLIVSCSAVQPIETAETIDQKAFALYAEYAIVASRAANISEDPATPMGVRRTILDALELTVPVARTLRDAAVTASRARHELEMAEKTTGAAAPLWTKFDIAVGALERLYRKAEPQITAFKSKIEKL